MLLHAIAKLGLAGQFALVRAVEGGLSLKAAAAAFSVSPATAHRWWQRWLEGAASRRRSATRSSRRGIRRGCWPSSCSSGSATVAARPAGGRGWSPARPALRIPRSGRCCGATASPAAQRRSRSRPTATSGPAPATCCTWTQPATRVSCGPATASPATARSAPATGCDRRPESATTMRTRSSTTTPARLRRAPSRRESRDRDRLPRTRTRFLSPSTGSSRKRLMTDNGFSYVKNRSLRDLLAQHGIRHLTTEPYRPRTNGKVERFHQTMAREWAYGLAYRSHRERNQALPHWISGTTTPADHTARSETGHPSAAFTTSVGSGN